jgi:rhodanese-related sulfurtransferase
VPRQEAAPAQEAKVNEGEIDVTELKQKIDRGDKFVLIDVREPHEYKICSIPGAKLIPLGEFPKHVDEFEDQDCKSGRHRDPLQERHAQRQGRAHASCEAGRLRSTCAT